LTLFTGMPTVVAQPHMQCSPQEPRVSFMPVSETAILTLKRCKDLFSPKKRYYYRAEFAMWQWSNNTGS